MRIAIPIDTASKNAQISEHFGRAKYFLIIDIEDGKIRREEIIENTWPRVHGRGAPWKILELKVDAVIASHMGANAFRILKSNGVKIYKFEGQALEAVEKYLKKELKEFGPEDLEHHHHEHHRH